MSKWKAIRQIIAPDCPLSIKNSEIGANGLFLRRDVREGECVLRVSSEHFINEQKCEGVLLPTVVNNSTGSSSSESDSEDEEINLTIEDKFCLYLIVWKGIYETQKQSNLYNPTLTYMSTLPEEVTLLDLATDGEIKIIQNTTRLQQIERRRQKLRSAFQRLQILSEKVLSVSNREFVSVSRFLWATAITESRAFSYRKSWVLIPFADMFNHSADGICDYGSDEGGFYFKAPRDMLEGLRFYLFIIFTNNTKKKKKKKKTGEEIFLRYNNWMNCFDFSKRYGFIPTGVVPGRMFPIKVDSSDSLKSRVLQTHELGTDDECYVEDGEPSEPLIVCLRMLSVKLDIKMMKEIMSGYAISLENELAAYTKLVELLKRQLSSYTTTLSEDRCSLLSVEMSYLSKLCLGIRIADKTALISAYSTAVKRHREIAMSSYYGNPPPSIPCPKPKPSTGYIGTTISLIDKKISDSHEDCTAFTYSSKKLSSSP